MRYFQPSADTRFYAGVDLHARTLFLVVLDQHGQIRYARNLPANPQAFRKAIAPSRDGLVSGNECMHCWYGLADTCRHDNIAFVLGHAWCMKAVHGSKSKCDRKDAEAIAHLLKGGNFPLAYAYPIGGAVSPQDVITTIYYCLGIAADTELTDAVLLASFPCVIRSGIGATFS